jgi:hypothetical protein
VARAWRPWVGGASLLVTVAVGCGEDRQGGAAGAPTPSLRSTTMVAPAAASPGASTAGAAGLAAPRGVRCAAAGSPKAVHLGKHPSCLQDLAVGPSGLFALGRDSARGDRWSVYRVAKDGSGVTVLARLEGGSPDAHLAIDEHAVYVSQQVGGENAGGDALVRVALGGGPPETLAEHFGWLGGVEQGFAYGLDRSVVRGTEAVVRMATAGGEVQVLFRRRVQRIGYRGGPYRFADLAVDQDGVFLADSGEGAIVRMPLGGGSPEPLLHEALSPCCLHLTGKRVFFGSTADWNAVASVSKAGGAPSDFDWRGLKSDAAGSWAVAPDGDHAIALGRGEQGGWRIYVLDADNKTIARAPLEHIDQTHAVADGECVYYVRVDRSGVSWFDAAAKPAA